MTVDAFGDPLVAARAADQPERFFDRFVFSLHPPAPPQGGGRTPAVMVGPTIMIGLGVHPGRGVVDGFVLVVTADEQRNYRFSTTWDDARRPDAWSGSADALSWRTVVPLREWRLIMAENPSGVTFDLTWRRRTPPWVGTVQVGGPAGGTAAFDHLFQSGHYEGTVTIDGVTTQVTGWLGTRDRSRGIRTLSSSAQG